MEAFDGTPLLAGQRIHDTIEMTPVVDPDRFRYAGVSLVVSRALLDARWFAALGSQDGVNLYRLRRPPILAAQVSRFTKGDGGKTVVLNGDLTSTNALAVRPLIMMDDFRRFGLRPADRESVLFISEQHHPSWRAAANGATLATVVINDFYLGVLIPPGTAVVELSFEPFVVWSWVPQAIFGGLGAGCLIAYGARHLRARVRRTKS
jgi:hypothetical protein